MKNYFKVFTLTFLFSLSAIAQSGGFWTPKTSLTSSGGTVHWRFSGSFSIGSKGYVVGGSNAPVVYTGDTWEFDPTTNSWAQKANFGGGTTSSSASFVVNNKAYICCGANPTMQNWLWQYDPATNIWQAKANFPGSARAYNISFAINGKGYSGFGYDANGVVKNDLYEYDPATDNWTPMANFPGGGRWSPIYFALGNKGYVGMGATTATWNNYSNDLWEFDPIANSWSQKNNFPGSARAEAASFDKCNYGYVGNGHNGVQEMGDFWEYAPITDTWNQLTNFPSTARSMTAGFSIADKCYLAMGYDNFVNNTGFGDIYEWDTKANFAISDTTICEGESIAFTDLSYNHPVTWNWNFNGATTISSTQQNPNSITYNSPGVFTITLVATDACGYAKTKTRTVTVSPSTANAGLDQIVCSGSSAQLNASGGTSYSWYSIPSGFASNLQNPIVNPGVPTNYVVTVTNANGCTKNDTVLVTPAVVTASFNPSTVSGTAPLTVTFNNTSTGATNYAWTFGDNNSSTQTNPSNVYNDQGQFNVVLIATNAQGCSDTARFTIDVNIDFSALWIPNAFSPNGDGLNDVFSVGFYNLRSFNCKVFDRWGELVAELNDPTKGWDGKFKGNDVEEGVYVVVVNAVGQDDERYDKKGHVSLIR